MKLRPRVYGNGYVHSELSNILQWSGPSGYAILFNNIEIFTRNATSLTASKEQQPDSSLPDGRIHVPGCVVQCFCERSGLASIVERESENEVQDCDEDGTRTAGGVWCIRWCPRKRRTGLFWPVQPVTTSAHHREGRREFFLFFNDAKSLRIGPKSLHERSKLTLHGEEMRDNQVFSLLPLLALATLQKLRFFNTSLDLQPSEELSLQVAMDSFTVAMCCWH